MEEESDDKDDTKRKSRNLSEKKRRDQFNSLVNDLSALISTSNRKMDKSTVLKSTIAFLKHHNEATDRSKVFEIQQDWKPSFLTNDEFTHLMLEALDGFIIVFSSSGSIYYASESIISLLGYLPSDLLNMTIFDLTYEMDHESLYNIFLNPTPVIEPLQTDIMANNQITFHAHLKRGGLDKVDANAYELVKFVGYFRNDANVDNLPPKNTQTPPRIYQAPSGPDVDQKLIFVGTGRVQTPQLIREMSAIDPTRNEFTSKHSMEWKFLFLDHRAPPIIGYMPFEVLGTSGYDYYHFDDLEDIVACHEELLQKGDGKSCYYRFLTKGQQWIWLQTDFYVSYHQYSAKPDYVVCTHKVVSYADVIKQGKAGSKGGRGLSVAAPPAVKSATVTLRDLEAAPPATNAVVGSSLAPSCGGGNGVGVGVGVAVVAAAGGGLLNDVSPTLDAVNMWPATPSASGTTSASTNPTPQATPLKTSRPPSSYGNISSAGISPNVKRKRYFHHSRGNDSDSTSMSADSGASRHSLLTHLSSQSRQRQSMSHMHQQQQQQQQQQNQASQQQHHINHQQQPQQTAPIGGQTTQGIHHQAALQMTPAQTQQKLVPMLQQHSIASGPMMAANAPCQFTQPAFPLRNQPLVGRPFLEPSQFLTAIPVQPVIAPFPMAPVLSPISHQPELLPSAAAVVMTPTQSQLQDQLQRKHDELQKLIMQQQDELRIVSEQLLLARYTLLQPVVPMSYNNASGGSSRNFGFVSSAGGGGGVGTGVGLGGVGVGNHNNNQNHSGNNNAMDQQFSQYGFSMNTDQLQASHEQQQQQMMLQQHQYQQTLQQQQVQSQQQQQMLHNSQHLQQQQQQQQSLMSRSVPDLEQFGQEEIDAFLNLSPLQSISSQAGINPTLGSGGTVNNNANISNNNSGGNPNGSTNHQPALNNIGGSNGNGSNNNRTHNHNNNVAVIGVNNVSSSNNNNNPQAQSQPQSLNHGGFGSTQSTPQQSNEDSLLSYMQMAADPSPGLTFQMGISDDGSESRSEDAKLLHNHSHHQHPQQHQQQQLPMPQQQQQQQSRSFFSTNPFQSLSQTSAANQMPNDLEILPYQMSQEQSQDLFNSPHTPGASQ